MSVMMITALPNKMAGRGHLAWPALGASPYISHYLCMIGQICDETRLLFCRCEYAVASGDARVLERLSDYESREAISEGPGVMPRGLRVAATCVRQARPARWRQRRDAWQRSPRYGLPDTLTPSQP
jgi:hypothetical protein